MIQCQDAGGTWKAPLENSPHGYDLMKNLLTLSFSYISFIRSHNVFCIIYISQVLIRISKNNPVTYFTSSRSA